MIKSEATSPLDTFVAHGVKTIDAYMYILLVDQKGQALIERVALDQSTIKFAAMPVSVHTHYTDIALDIDAFWASPTSYTYSYLYQC